MTDPPSPLAGGGAAGPAGRGARDWLWVMLAAWKNAGENNLGLISAGVAFYAFLAFVPLLTAFMLSYGLFAEPAAVVVHVQTLTQLMPQNAAEIVGDQLKSMTETSGTETGFALIVAIGIAFYGASRGAAAVITALNIAFETQESRGLVGRTLMALLMTAGAVLVLFLAILAVSALNLAERLLPGLGGAVRLLLKGVFFMLAGSATIVLLAVIYRYGPNRPDASWRWITPGSTLATIVWLAATMGFGAYVSNFGDYNATYGSLGAVIVFLTWLYLSAYIGLLGAELNAVLENWDMPRRDMPALREDPASGERSPAAPAPSIGSIAVRLSAFSMLLALLGRSRPKADRRRRAA